MRNCITCNHTIMQPGITVVLEAQYVIFMFEADDSADNDKNKEIIKVNPPMFIISRL